MQKIVHRYILINYLFFDIVLEKSGAILSYLTYIFSSFTGVLRALKFIYFNTNSKVIIPSNRYYKLWLEIFKSGLFTRIKPNAWKLYTYLLSQADFTTSECTVSQKVIAEKCNINRSSASPICDVLNDYGLIKINNKTTRAGQQKNSYIICKPLDFIGDSLPPCQSFSKEGDYGLEMYVQLNMALFDRFFNEIGHKHVIWKVYCALLYRADFKTGKAFPSYKTLARDCGLSVPTVVKAVKFLYECGLIIVGKRRTISGTIANSYTVWPNIDTHLTETTARIKTEQQPGFNQNDTQDLNVATATAVEIVNTNYKNQNIYNTSSSKEIEELLIMFYGSNDKRKGQPRKSVEAWLNEKVAQYGFNLVKSVIYKNPLIYSTKKLEDFLENEALLKPKPKVRKSREQELMALENEKWHNKRAGKCKTNPYPDGHGISLAAKERNYRQQVSNGGPEAFFAKQRLDEIERKKQKSFSNPNQDTSSSELQYKM